MLINAPIIDAKQYYTLYDANDLIPRMEYLFSQLCHIQQSINSIYIRANEQSIDLASLLIVKDDHSSEMDGPYKKEIVELSFEYKDLLDQFYVLGLELDDLDSCIVRIYSWLDGEEVCLSWQFGEQQISFWHYPTEPHDSRRPLDDNSSQANTVICH